MKFPSPLSPEEEQNCLKKIKDGDQVAKDTLILHNMRLVAHVVKRYAQSEDEAEELISIGTIGLIKSVTTFDPDFGSRFATYAIRCIENELLMYFRSRKKSKGEVSLFEPIGTDKEGNHIHLFDILESEEQDVTESMESYRLMNLLKENMDRILTPREMLIIKKRYGILGEEEQTQKQIADDLGISRSYVSRIEKKSLEKLLNFLKK